MDPDGKVIRVLIAKPGLDGHEAGAKIVAQILRDSGMEVIYTGPRQTSATIVATAIQEDVDLIGLSILSGSHKEFSKEITDMLDEKDANIPVIVGGIIPPKDVSILKSIGIKDVFGPGSNSKDIVKRVREIISETSHSQPE